jgi:hypothetical protein
MKMRTLSVAKAALNFDALVDAVEKGREDRLDAQPPPRGAPRS